VPIKDRSSLPIKTQLLPKEVRTKDTPFLHPDNKINESLVDGQQVIVDLYTSLELDEYDTPQLSPWAFLAFRHDARHQEERARLTDETNRQVELYQSEKAAAALQRKIEIETPKINRMKEVMRSQLISDDDIATTLSSEWLLIKNSGKSAFVLYCFVLFEHGVWLLHLAFFSLHLTAFTPHALKYYNHLSFIMTNHNNANLPGILDNIVPDEAQQEEIRSFLTKNFVELNDLYKFYSAVNSGGGTHTLEYIELCKFLSETGILGEESSNAILRIFVDSHIKSGKGRGMRPSIHSEIRRYEFFVALIKISILKNITLPKRELSKQRRLGKEVSISRANLPTAPRALMMIYEEYLLPVLEKMPAGKKMREAVGSDSVLILYYDNLENLVKCFEKYTGESGDELSSSDDDSDDLISNSSIPDGSMSIQDFVRFANKGGFLDDVQVSTIKHTGSRRHSIMGQRSSSTISQKDVRQIFSASQHDNEASVTEQKKVRDDDNVSSDQELMIFSEFLESIARLGVLKWHNNNNIEMGKEGNESSGVDDLTYYDCIKLAVDKVCSMVT